MKKHITAMLLALALFGCGPTTTPTKPGDGTYYVPWVWTKNGLPSTELTQATDPLKTPEQITEYLQKNIEWKDDYNTIEFLSPNELIASKRAVCSGFARFWQYSLAKAGYTSHFIAIWGPNSAHAITVFQYKGYWRVASNQYYYGAEDKIMGVVGRDYLETAAINGAIEFYGQNWRTIQIYDESGKVAEHKENYTSGVSQLTPGSSETPDKTVFNIKR